MSIELIWEVIVRYVDIGRMWWPITVQLSFHDKLNPSHFCACPKLWPRFPTTSVVILFRCFRYRKGVVHIGLVILSTILYCLTFLFSTKKKSVNKKLKKACCSSSYSHHGVMISIACTLKWVWYSLLSVDERYS
jgi:hypothetical protein